MKYSYDALREMAELGHNDLKNVQIKTSKGIVLKPNKWQCQTFARSMCTEAAHHQSNAHGVNRFQHFHQAGSSQVPRVAERAKRGSR